MFIVQRIYNDVQVFSTLNIVIFKQEQKYMVFLICNIKYYIVEMKTHTSYIILEIIVQRPNFHRNW